MTTSSIHPLELACRKASASEMLTEKAKLAACAILLRYLVRNLVRADGELCGHRPFMTRRAYLTETIWRFCEWCSSD